MAQAHPYPGKEFSRSEGLAEVVVGSLVEGVHLGSLVPPGGDDDHRKLEVFPDPPQNLHAVDVGEPEIEQNDVGDEAVCERQTVGSALGDLRPIAVRLESRGDEALNGAVVLDYQDELPHRFVALHGVASGTGCSEGTATTAGREILATQPVGWLSSRTTVPP